MQLYIPLPRKAHNFYFQTASTHHLTLHVLHLFFQRRRKYSRKIAIWSKRAQQEGLTVWDGKTSLVKKILFRFLLLFFSHFPPISYFCFFLLLRSALIKTLFLNAYVYMYTCICPIPIESEYLWCGVVGKYYIVHQKNKDKVTKEKEIYS